MIFLDKTEKSPRNSEARDSRKAYYGALAEVRKESRKNILYKWYLIPKSSVEDAGYMYYSNNISLWLKLLGEEHTKKAIKLLILYTKNGPIASQVVVNRLYNHKINSHIPKMAEMFDNLALEKEGKAIIEKLYEKYYDPGLSRKQLTEKANEMLLEEMLRK